MLEGRPSRHSDQYGLAIVYQEMLTGKSPFSGRTMAQLAAQHLHSQPCLTPLPAADRPIVARALSKRSEQRFPNCRALVDKLAESPTSGSGSTSRRTRSSSAASAAGREGLAKTFAISPVTPVEGQAGSGDQGRKTTATIRDLDRVELNGINAECRPAIFVGVGGLGGRVLTHLQRRLRNRFSDVAAVPALQMLLIDTDNKELSSAAFGRGEGCLPTRSTLAMPLRPPKEYRSESKDLLQWISRRWLYNIPRSLQTEGMRPLGRLAFVDHFRAIADRLRKCIETADSDEAAKESRETTGLDFRIGGPNVFVISSISGGTGSGSVLDLAYTIRKVLTDAGRPDERVCGILTHATSRKASSAISQSPIPSRVLKSWLITAARSKVIRANRRANYFPSTRSPRLSTTRIWSI